MSLRAGIAALLLAMPGIALGGGDPAPRAFPGAEGFGAFASGGRGGRVIAVTTLADDGPGSLRAALRATGPRTIVFRTGGTIMLRTPLTIRTGDLTVAGQTAPGGGICIRNQPVVVAADNVILRFLRFRLGDADRTAEDALSAGARSGPSRPRQIIIDHCSMSWGVDECGSFYDVEDFTLQWSFVTESLHRSAHPKGTHGFGGIWGGRRASFHHNLLAHHTSRTPRFNGSRTSGERAVELVDMRNNVVYNWGFNSAYGGESGNQNIVANYYKPGPATKPNVRSRILEPLDDEGTWYIAGNVVAGDPAVTADNWSGVQGRFAAAQKGRRLPAPLPDGGITTQPAGEAYALVLAHAGATLPRRDAVDARIAHEVATGTASGGGSWGEGKGIIDTQDAVGGWPALDAGVPPEDTDGDGMPDAWERGSGLDPANPADGPALLADGTTNLETYLNGLVPPPDGAVGPPVRIPDTLPWSERIASSFLLRHPGGVTFDSLSPDQRWNYEQGLMLLALLDMWRHTGDRRHLEFVKANLDRYVDSSGAIRTYRRTDYNLDNIGPGRALLALHRETGDMRYRSAADTLRRQLREQPRTNAGGFWHKRIYPYQMWLDGLFMAAPFLTEYALLFHEPEALEDVVHQFVLIERHTRDSATGLLFHGWDESRAQRWADPVTGRSPAFWGRSMGWYAMALVDVLDLLPATHPRRGELTGILRRLAAAVVRVQDSATGLWYQVPDQPGREGNYLESSASAMFAYAFTRGVQTGALDTTYAGPAARAFRGLTELKVSVSAGGFIDLHDICRSAGLGGKPYRDGSFAYYISEPRRMNDMKGYGPLLRAAIRLEQAAGRTPR